MKAKQILFNGENVRAILDGRKTQTRRVIRGPGNAWHIDRLLGEWALSDVPMQWDGEKYPWRWQGKKTPQIGDWIWNLQTDVDDSATWPIRCPYGKPGELLWVRETWQNCIMCGALNFRAAHDPYHCNDCDDPLGNWKPSIFMRRADSRLTLLVKRVWVERVQDISLYDAVQEGYPDYSFPVPDKRRRFALISRKFNVLLPKVKSWFVDLWDSINAKRGLDWNMNPWVFAIEFEVTV